MDDIAYSMHDKALLNVLRDFYDIYINNPDISDMDAMITYIQNYTDLKNVEAISTIPEEIRSTLDLGLKTNLTEYVQKYAKEYHNKELLIGANR